MNRSFLLHFLLLLFLNILIKPFYLFGIDRSVQNILGPSDYGTFYIIFNATYLFSIVCDLGSHHYLLTEVSKNKQNFSTLLPQALAIRLFGMVVYALCLFGFAYWFDYLQYGELLVYMGFFTVLTSLFLFFRAQLQALGYFTIESFVSVLDKVLLIILLGYCIWFKPEVLSLAFFIKIQFSTILFAALVSGVLVLVLGMKLIWPMDFSLKAVLKQTLPYSFVLFLMLLYNRIDVAMLKILATEASTEAGIYAAGYRILDFLNMLGFMLGSLSIPMFARLEKEALFALFKTTLNLMWAITIVVSAAIWFYKDAISELLYTSADSYWALTLGVLALSFIPVGIGYVLSSFFTAKQKIKECTVLFGAAVLINIALNAYFIPSSGALGAAITTLITQFIILLGFFMYLKKEYPSLLKVVGLKHFLFTGIIFLVFYISSILNEANILYTIVPILVSIGFSFAFKLLDIKEIISIALPSKKEDA